MRKIILVSCLCFLTILQAKSYHSGLQTQLQFRSLTIDNGLSNNQVHSITQDSIGYMWFATANGLNKYDGYNITQYIHRSNDSLTILSNDVNVVFTDSEGNLWAGSVSGLCLYDRQLDRFTEFRHPKLDAQITGVRDVVEDKQGKVWIAAVTGVYIYNLKTAELQIYRNAANEKIQFPSFSFQTLFVDRNNHIWFTTMSSGLFKFDQNTEELKTYQHDPDNDMSLRDNKTEGVYEDTKGRIWIGTYNHGINLFDPKTENIRKIVPDTSYQYSTRVRVIWEDDNGNLFFGTRGGLYIMDPKTEEFIHHTDNSNAFFQLSQNSIRCHYIDRAGTVWLGTFDGGVYFADLYRKQIVHYPAKIDDNRFLSDRNVFSITEDIKGDLWIGTNHGLNKLNQSSRLFSHYTHDPENNNSISFNDIKALASDTNGNVWIGTTKGGMDCYNIYDRSIQHYIYDPENSNTLASNEVYGLFLDSSDQLWVITGHSESSGRQLNLLSSNKRDFIRFHPDIFLGIAEDQHRNMWFGGIGGVWYFERETGNFTFIQNDSLLGNVNTVHADSNNMLWIGSNKGLVCYQPQTEKFKTFNRDFAFPFHDVLGILEDDHKNLWISTSNGIVKFIKAVQSVHNPQFQELRLVDGIQSKQFNLNAYYKSQTGEMYFGGINGFNVFHPDDIVKNPYKPDVTITSLNLFNEKVLVGKEYNGRVLLPVSLASLENLVLGHRNYVFSLEFSAFHYAHPEHNQFAYKLEGFEKDWNYTDGSRRLATYTSLPAGDYTFMVKAANYDGVWNEKSANLSITVLPPWWRTIWAYLIYFMFAGILLYSIWRFQLNRRALKHELMLEHQHAEKLEELNAMKSRFFSNITHEFRSPLTLIMGPLQEYLSGETKEDFQDIAKMALRNSKRLYQLINQLLELSKLEAGRVQLFAQKVDIFPFVENIVVSYASLAESKKIDLQLTLAKDISKNEPCCELYFDPDKVQKIISNLLSNAIKFTSENGHVSVSVQKKCDSVDLSDKKDTMQSDKSPGRLIPQYRNLENNISPIHASNIKKFSTYGYVEVCIKDDGIGIRDEDLAKVFNRFYQVTDLKNKTIKSFGIGLALVKELTELHSGTIHVESVYGEGSSFFIRLPLGAEHLLPEEISTELYNENQSAVLALEDTRESANETVMLEETEKVRNHDIPILLIVDDNPDICKFVADHLKKEYQIVTAKDGQEGFTKAISQIPDLIVSDVSMPIMNGMELCAQIKQDERTSHIPVILLTVRSSEESKVEGLEIGADDYITKPFEIKELKARIHNLIEQRRKLQEKFNQKTGLKPSDITTNSVDEQFIDKALSCIENNIGENTFGVEELAEELSLHRVHLYRKIRAITGQSASEFIRSVRLNRAAQLIKQKYGNISEIAYDVGFHNPSYFSNCFHKQFGVYPSEYVEK